MQSSEIEFSTVFENEEGIVKEFNEYGISEDFIFGIHLCSNLVDFTINQGTDPPHNVPEGDYPIFEQVICWSITRQLHFLSIGQSISKAILFPNGDIITYIPKGCAKIAELLFCALGIIHQIAVDIFVDNKATASLKLRHLKILHIGKSSRLKDHKGTRHRIVKCNNICSHGIFNSVMRHINIENLTPPKNLVVISIVSKGHHIFAHHIGRIELANRCIKWENIPLVVGTYRTITQVLKYNNTVSKPIVSRIEGKRLFLSCIPNIDGFSNFPNQQMIGYFVFDIHVRQIHGLHTVVYAQIPSEINITNQLITGLVLLNRLEFNLTKKP